ncbi:MAG: ComEC/Rec2 family competence protein [Candidatus Sericytochromatia bacterium]|nr:ComEC/Rec2 family competence protein [Candidatus Sericytochromatia bacterium]
MSRTADAEVLRTPQLFVLLGLWATLVWPAVGVVAGLFVATSLLVAATLLPMRPREVGKVSLLVALGVLIGLLVAPRPDPPLPPGPWAGLVRVLEEPRLLPWGQVSLEARQLAPPGARILLVLSCDPGAGIWPGRTLRVEGRVSAQADRGLPRLACRTWSLQGLPRALDPDYIRACLEARLVRAATRAMPPREAGFMRSLLFGAGNPAMAEGDMRRFRDLGLSHILAVSGFQVSLLVGVLARLLRPLATAPWLAGLCLGFGTWIYAGLCGFDAAVSRAAAMATAMVLARATGRWPAPAPALLLGVIGLLVVSPGLATSLGLAFSTLATWGILSAPPSPGRPLSWWWPGLWAQVWCLPLQLAVFGAVSPWGLLAGPFLDLGVTMLTLGGFLRCVLGMAGLDPYGLTGLALGFAAGLVLRVLQPLSQLPGAPWVLPLASGPGCAIVLGGLMGAAVTGRLRACALPLVLSLPLLAALARPTAAPVVLPTVLASPGSGTAWLLPGAAAEPVLWLLPRSPRVSAGLRRAAVQALQVRGLRGVSVVVLGRQVHPGPWPLHRLLRHGSVGLGSKGRLRRGRRGVACLRWSGGWLVVADRTSRQAEAEASARLPEGRRMVWWRVTREQRGTVLLRSTKGDVALSP